MNLRHVVTVEAKDDNCATFCIDGRMHYSYEMYIGLVMLTRKKCI
jgi:hypothetical protein